MIPIAVSENLQLHSPKKKKFSFFNSPYPAHRQFAGLDIYPSNRFGDIAPSPLDGVVKQIRFVQTPPALSFQKHKGDFVILIESTENPNRWVKVLHVDPIVKENQVLKKGDPIGRLLRSGFFGYSTPPHMHLEVRHPNDPLRAKGGFGIERLIPALPPKPIKKLSGKIVKATPQYLVMDPDEKFLMGIPCELDGVPALLDGGIPYYRWFGLHTDHQIPNGARRVTLCGKLIGRLETSHLHFHSVRSLDFEFRMDDIPVGCSFHLYHQINPVVYIVPLTDRKPLGLPGESVTITIKAGGQK